MIILKILSQMFIGRLVNNLSTKCLRYKRVHATTRNGKQRQAQSTTDLNELLFLIKSVVQAKLSYCYVRWAEATSQPNQNIRCSKTASATLIKPVFWNTLPPPKFDQLALVLFSVPTLVSLPDNRQKEKWPDSYHRFCRDFSDHSAFVHPLPYRLLPPSAWTQSAIISTSSDDLYYLFFLNIISCRAVKIRAELWKVSRGIRWFLLLLPKNLWLWQLTFDNLANDNLTWATPPNTRKSEITLWLLIKSVPSGGRNFRQRLRKANKELGQFLRNKFAY